VGVWRVDGDPAWGSRSATYPVVLTESEDRAAMTVFDAPALHLGSYPRRILSIAQRLAAVEHPGIASIVDAGLTADGRPYVVTDLEQAVPLKDCMTGMELSRALALLRAICAPLLAAHDVGIAHGSLSLDHVFLVESDARYVKLIDWGIERAVFDEAHRAGLESTTETLSAPEAALGLCSPQMDAYALGALAERLLGSDMPPALSLLVGDLMADDPRHRPSLRNAADRLAAIQRELDAPPIVVAIPDIIPNAVVELRPRRSWRVALSTAALAAAAAVSFAVGPHGLSAPAPVTTMALSPVVPMAEPVALASSAVTPMTEPAPVVPRVAPIVVVEKPPVVVRPPPPPSPPVKKPRVQALDDNKRNELLAQYQRIGRALYELQAQRGTAATSELMQQFKELKIEPALATHKSRTAAAATLGELRTRLERQRGVDVADACLKNALADGCR